MEQRYIQWGNNIEVGHGAISGGVDWKQEKLTSSSTTLSDAYKRDTTGLYLTGQQQIDSVTTEASGREDHDEQFGWHGTWQTAAGWEFIDGYRATLSYGTGFWRRHWVSNMARRVLLRFMGLALLPTQT